MRSTKLPSWIERLLGLDAQQVPPSIFTLDERTLRYGGFERAGLGHGIAELGSFELAPGAFFAGPMGGPLRDADAFSAQLEGLLAQTSERPREASLVLPDRWLRLVFAEIGELPEAPAARLEALRFKLRRLVPFRVEDLRIEALEVAPLPDQSETRRILISFAVQTLLDQLETLFEAAGVRLGLIANQTVCLTTALPAKETVGLLLAVDQGYSMLILHRSEPLLYRYKTLSEDLDPVVLGSIVGRDLQLTRSFLDEKIGPETGREMWVASSSDPASWVHWVETGFGTAPRVLSTATLPMLEAFPAELLAVEGGAMIGAAMQEVA